MIGTGAENKKSSRNGETRTKLTPIIFCGVRPVEWTVLKQIQSDDFVMFLLIFQRIQIVQEVLLILVIVSIHFVHNKPGFFRYFLLDIGFCLLAPAVECNLIGFHQFFQLSFR